MMELDETSTQLFDDLVTGRENERFIDGGSCGYIDPLRMVFTDAAAAIQCNPYRRLDSPSPAKDDCNPAENNLSNLSSYDGDMTLPLLDDFRLDERDIASRIVGPGSSSHSQSWWRGRIGKRTSTERGRPGKCKVCGDLATGMYFGALVCVPCKTFFLRYEGDNFNFVCKASKDCEITMATRTQCKFCRYQKCREAGMVRRVRPAHVNLNEGQQLCVVCHDVANGIHFGAVTCEGCKKFFRRGLSEHAQYSCKNGQICIVNPRTRNSCRYCRYKTCLSVGMSREAIQMGRPSKLAVEGNRIQRGPRTMNGDKDHQLDTSLGSVKGIVPHYLMGNRHPKDEPPGWDWQMDQTVLGHATHPDAGNYAGPMAGGVCDFLDSPAKHVGMEEYDSPHPGSAILTPMSGSSGGDRASSNGCLSHMGNVSSEAVRYGNGGWGEVTVCVSKPGDVQPLSALYHAGEGGVHQMDSPSPYDPRPTGGQEHISNHALSKFYHDKANIPVAVSSDLFQFPADGIARHQSLKLGHLNPSQVEPFSLPRSLKMDPNGRKTDEHLQHYTNVLESLLDNPCQAQELIGLCGKQDHFGFKYDAGVVYLDKASDRQQITSTDGIDRETSGGDRAFENARPSGDGAAQFAATRSSQTGATGRYETVTESPSSTPFGLRSPERHLGYLHFDASAEPSSTSKTAAAQCTPPPPPHPPQGPESNASPVSTGPARNDAAAAVPTMMMMSDETKNSMDSIAEWVFQLQQSYVDSNDEETPAVFPNEDLIGVCRGLHIDGVPFEKQIERSIQYWKSQELPDENIMVGAEHWRLFNHFHPLYANYVSMGSTWNHNLRIKFEQWNDSQGDSGTLDDTMVWVKENVFPAYTDLSHSYFTQIQGFRSFDVHDQRILLRLAQSQSRVLAAALAWFNSDSQTFTDFLPWRKLNPGQVDLFKELLTDYAKNIQSRNLDPVESALFNIVVVIATDYPGLVRPYIIERYRTQFLATFRAYTTAKYGTPNKRMEKLFQLVPQLRRLGHLHYAMTLTPNIGMTTVSASKTI